MFATTIDRTHLTPRNLKKCTSCPSVLSPFRGMYVCLVHGNQRNLRPVPQDSLRLQQVRVS